MAKNVDQTLVDIRTDEVLREDPEAKDSKPLTIRTVSLNVLLGALQNDHPSGEEKASRYALAMKIRAGGEIDFTPEDLTLLKKLVGISYAPLVVGQFYEWAQI